MGVPNGNRGSNHATKRACVHAMFKAVVIRVNERVKDMRSLVNIASAEAKKREGTHRDISIKTVKFIPECDVYVALYEWKHKTSGARGWKAGGE